MSSRTSFICQFPLYLAICILAYSLPAQALTVSDIGAAETATHPHPEEDEHDEVVDAEESTDQSVDKKSDQEEVNSKSDPNSTSDSESSTKEQESQPDAGEDKQDSGSKKPESHTVELGPLKVDVELDGLFVASDSSEVVLRPEEWSRFEVVEAVAHGTRVNKGDVLIRFDDEDLEKDIAEETVEQRLSELALMQFEEEFPRVQRQREMAFERAKLAHEQMVEDFEYYKSTDRPFSVEIAHHRYKSAQEDLASQHEELAQLEKMYAADDLTEETEQIVLRRQRFQVAAAELNLRLREAARDYSLNVTLPRSDDSFRRSLERSKLQLEQAKIKKEKGTIRAKYELEQKRRKRAESIERHANLLSDRSLMVVRSPADGVVYYGKCTKGKWSEIDTLAKKLKPHGTVSANSVLMTVVDQRPLEVVAKIAERELTDFQVGQVALVVPSADDKLELKAKVTEVGNIPGTGNKYPVVLEVNLSDAPAWLVAGMECDASVTVYENQEAMLIPKSMLNSSEADDEEDYVLVLDDQGEPQERKVSVGRKKDGKVEILSGLNVGDEVVKADEDESDDAS